jgi:hypothetical protein
MTAAHVHIEEQHHGPSHEGSVVLDIGGSIGALVLHTDDDLAGLEIDITGHSPGTVSTHSLIRPRELPHGTAYAAVYPCLPAGRYRLIGVAGRSDQDLVIQGGRVTELDWRRAVRRSFSGSSA